MPETKLAPSTPLSPLSVPPVLRRVWWVMVALTVASAVFLLIAYLLQTPPVYYRFLSLPGDDFSDFYIFKHKFLFFHTAEFFTTDYPYAYTAPMTLLYQAFFLLGDYDLGTFLAFSCLALLVPVFLFGRALVRRGLSRLAAYSFAATMLVCSWPAVLLVDRANVEIFVWVALLLAVWAFVRGRDNLAAVCFALAASLKLFPFIFLALFLSKKNWCALALGAATFFGVSLASYAVLGPTIPVAFHGINAGLEFFRVECMGKWRWYENGTDHCLFGLVKFIETRFFGLPETGHFLRSLTVYNYVVSFGGTALYLLHVRKLPLLNQYLVFSIASIWFTAFSGDGTLIHLYCGYVLLVFLAIDAWRRRLSVPGLNAALYLLVFSFSYEAYTIWHGQRYEGQVKSLALGVLMCLVLRYRFGPSLRRESASNALVWPDASVIEPA